MTPLAVLCGFLGAGKTTFLRRLVPAVSARGLRPRVILNDYQNARVDVALLGEVAALVEPVSGSCICCGSREELVGALAAIEPGPRQVVLVEANGTTDTEAMLEILGGAPELRALTPPVQLTVVDATRAGRRDWRNELERVQLRTATHVFVSRRDLVDPARWREVEALVRAVAPRARASDPEAFAVELDAIEREVAQQPAREAGRAADHDHEAHARYHFASLELPLPGRADPDGFAAFLRALPPAVLRAKGIVDLGPPVDGKRTFQKVEGEVAVSDCELHEPESLPTTAIFIGVELPADEIRAAVAAVMAR